jgi:hypothetical protein
MKMESRSDFLAENSRKSILSQSHADQNSETGMFAIDTGLSRLYLKVISTENVLRNSCDSLVERISI